MTFAQARKKCHDQGAELASVLSAGEQGAIVKYLMDPPYSKGIDGKGKTKIRKTIVKTKDPLCNNGVFP